MLLRFPLIGYDGGQSIPFGAATPEPAGFGGAVAGADWGGAGRVEAGCWVGTRGGAAGCTGKTGAGWAGAVWAGAGGNPDGWGGMGGTCSGTAPGVEIGARSRRGASRGALAI